MQKYYSVEIFASANDSLSASLLAGPFSIKDSVPAQFQPKAGIRNGAAACFGENYKEHLTAKPTGVTFDWWNSTSGLPLSPPPTASAR